MAATRAPTRAAVDLLLNTMRSRHGPVAAQFHSLRCCPKLPARSLYSTAARRAIADQKKQEPAGTEDHARPRNARTAPLGLLVGGGLVSGLLASFFALSQPAAEANDDAAPPQTHTTPAPTAGDSRDPSLPRFRLADVRKHGAASAQPWVTYEDKVYDITEWVGAHPGGDVILRAAGGSIEPYWNIFSIHKAPHVREILDQYLIGYIDAADLLRREHEAIEDPFVADPERDARLVTHTSRPRNAEPPTDELTRAFHTPSSLFYVRNHMWVPVVGEGAEGDEHAVTVELPDGETRRYTLGELKARFPTHRITAALQCSGNRRSDMTRQATKTNGLQWGVGAISNAEWEGVRLADVLADAGLRVADAQAATAVAKPPPPPDDDDDDDAPPPPASSLHVQFSGLEAYGASIPLETALDPRGDVLLAFGMNGAPLPRDHGFPLRAIVPGHVAARSVKWLSKIAVADEESSSQWQRRDYKGFGPNEGASPDWDRAKAIQEMPVTSAITGVWVGRGADKAEPPATPPPPPAEASSPTGTNGRADAEPVTLEGYAYAGGGRAIARVDVSLDGGKSWDQAALVDDCAGGKCPGNRAWAWTRWRYSGQLPPAEAITTNTETDTNAGGKKACTTLVVKATDDAYNAQPETHASVYNVRGNLATAWHRVRLCRLSAGAVEWETDGCGFVNGSRKGGAEGQEKEKGSK